MEEKLRQADLSIAHHPAETLKLLNSIDAPSKEDKAHYLQYIVLRSMANIMTGTIDLNKDELKEACLYFKKTENLRYRAIANYLVGCCYQVEDDNIHSLRWFYESAYHSDNLHEDKLTGKALFRISYAYFEQGVYSEAARQSKQALGYFRKVPNSEIDMLESISMIGLWHYKTNELDSALVRYQEGLDIAYSIDDDEYIARFKAFMGTVYGSMGKTDEAVSYLSDAVLGVTTDEDLLLVYKGFLKTYNVKKQVAKAAPYAEILSKRLDDIKLKSRQRESVHELSRHYELAGDYRKSLKYSQEESRMFYEMELAKSAEDFLTIKEEYDLSLMWLDMENQKLWYVVIISSLVLAFLLIAAILYFRIREIRYKNHKREEEVRMLGERVKSFEYLRSMYKGTIVRLAKMDKRVEDLIDESKTASGEVPSIYLEMQSLIKSLRRNSNYHYVRIAEDYIKKQPKGEELSQVLDRPNKIIYMLCNLRYNQTEMASMVGMTRKSVMMRRYDIRNAMVKVGIPEKTATSMIFFDQNKKKSETTKTKIRKRIEK